MIALNIIFNGINTTSTTFSFIDNGTVTSPRGFKASGIHCGIKNRKKDLALIYSECGCEVAGTFTRNTVKAAPVILSQTVVAQGGKVSAILVNSGNANACTGNQGMTDAKQMQSYCAQQLHLAPDNVLVASTGIIGKKLPVDKIKKGIDACTQRLSVHGGFDAAEAIGTTDTSVKSFACTVQLSKGTVTIGGICKGSGMIMPSMATMLAFITTDAAIEKELLQNALSHAVSVSFNRITVDSDTSTNDMVLSLANGCSDIRIDGGSDDYAAFSEALCELCKVMAKSIVADGEGATKLITITVRNAVSEKDADVICRAIANSPLVKTALHGADLNWGRIFSAAGKTQIPFEAEKASLLLNDIPLIRPSYEICGDQQEVKKALNSQDVRITLSLHKDKGCAASTWWTCDLTKEYVAINALYTT